MNIAVSRISAMAWMATRIFLLAVAVVQHAAAQTNIPVPAPGCDLVLTAGPEGVSPCEPAQQQAADDSLPKAPEDEAAANHMVLHYTPALNGGDPLVVPQPFHLRYLFGGGITEGFDSAATGARGNFPTSVSIFDGYLAASAQWRKTYLLIQQASTFTAYSSQQVNGQAFHRSAALVAGDFNQSWNWSLEALGTAGNDAIRQANPLPERMIGQFASAEPITAAYGINNGRVWGAELAGSLNWNRDLQRAFKLSIKNAYHFISSGNNNNIANARLEYQRKISERTSYGLYATTNRQTGQLVCNSSGWGVEVTTRLTAASVLELATGPELSSSACGRRQAFNLHAAVAGALNDSTRLYVNANREFSNGYVGSGSEDNIVVGLGKKLGRQILWSVDAGFVKGAILGSLTSYHASFVSTEIRKRLSESFTALGVYRRFDHLVAQQGFHRNVLLISLIWSPSGHGARRSDPFILPAEPAAQSRSNREE